MKEDIGNSDYRKRCSKNSSSKVCDQNLSKIPVTKFIFFSKVIG